MSTTGSEAQSQSPPAAAPLQVLLIGPCASDAGRLTSALMGEAGGDLDVTHVSRLEDALAGLSDLRADVIVLHLPWPGEPALATLARLQILVAGTPIVVTGTREDENLLIRAVHQGAHDYLLLDQIHPTVVVRTIRYALEQSHAQRTLEERESYYRSLFQESFDAIAVSSVDGQVLDANPAWLRLTGYAKEELVRLPPGTLWADPEQRKELVENIESRGAVRDFEMKLRRRDGSVLDCLVTTAAIRSAQDRPPVMQTIVRDITERKQAEESLRASEVRFRTVYEHAPLGIVEGSFPHGPARLNRALQRLLSLPPVCHLSLVAQRTHPDDVAEDTRLFREMVDGHRDHYELQKRYVTPDGRIVHTILYLSLVRDAAGGPHIIGMVEDLTERRKLEEQLRQSQKLEAVGRLAGGIAHDFNNILSVIGGCAQLLDLDLARGTPEPEDVAEILRATDRATSLVHQLLAFSRKQILSPEVVDVGDLVREIKAMLRRVIREDIEIRIQIDPGVGTALADPGQLHQVLLNLAVNARDAMPQGGTLSITAENSELTHEDAAKYPYKVKPGRYVRLSVQDTGTGMSEEVQREVFEPFFTTKGPGKGTGLGLSTVYGIVKQSGGYIWLRSEIGVGTTFDIYLPRVQGRPTDSVIAVDPSPAVGQGETILVVEDDQALRTLIRRTLQVGGYHVLEAANGEEALQVAEHWTETLHLVLTDVIMPVMNGRVLVDQLTELRPNLKVLYISGYADNVVVHHGALEPGVQLLQKPFTLDQLVAKVREVLADAGGRPGGP